VAGQDAKRALTLLGPLEARIMRAVWSGALPDSFVVRDVHKALPELAYTTVMTTVSRLAEKGLLAVKQIPRQKAYRYRSAKTADEFLTSQSEEQVDLILERFGDVALSAFAARLDALSAHQRRRLQELVKR